MIPVMLFYNNARFHVNNEENVLNLYLDLKKAFDTVDHQIRLAKLFYFNCDVRGKALAFYLVI